MKRICKTCNQEKEYYAKGLCKSCYRKEYLYKPNNHKEIEDLIKEIIKKKKIYYLSASRLFKRFNDIHSGHTPFVRKIKYAGVSIAKVLKNLERERFIKIYSVNESGYKMYRVNGK